MTQYQYQYHMVQAANHEKAGNLVQAEMHLDMADQCKQQSAVDRNSSRKNGEG